MSDSTQAPAVRHMDAERTATSLPSNNSATCTFCSKQAAWVVRYEQDDMWVAEAPEFMNTCEEHLYTAFS